MNLRQLGSTGIAISPLVLGGNVFGWTADKETSFALLDRFLDAGFNAIDTADVYNRYAPGLVGGESETIIGEWMKDRGVRDRMVIITKGGLPMGEGMEGLSRDYLPQACEASLRRLQTDYIDVHLAHCADPKVPIEETLQTYGDLISAGKIRAAGCSNYSIDDLKQALAAGAACGTGYQVVQPHYNLAERSEYEGPLEEICIAQGLGVVTYFSLAAGFLTGKYRSESDLADSARKNSAAAYLNPRNLKLLDVMDEIAKGHGATLAQIALAWLMRRPSVTAPIASATSLTQLADILGSTALALSADDMAALEAASATGPSS